PPELHRVRSLGQGLYERRDPRAVARRSRASPDSRPRLPPRAARRRHRAPHVQVRAVDGRPRAPGARAALLGVEARGIRVATPVSRGHADRGVRAHAMKTPRMSIAPAHLARVVVIGTSGAGKTTFAGRLASRLGTAHIELDALHWGHDWTPRS